MNNSDNNTDDNLDNEKMSEPTNERAQLAMSRFQQQEPASTRQSSPGIIILQWLTYAFWGWTLLAFVWLAYIVFASFMSPMDTSGMVPYAIASSLVLLPIAVLCDLFYLRKEPAKKQGAAMVVMVIHAVIFALFGIGVLIAGVVTLVNMAIGSPSDASFLLAWVYTAFLSTVVYAFAFLRTLNPFSSNAVAKWFWVGMALLVTGFVIASFIGPVANARLTREDANVESAVERINNMIQSHAQEYGEVPGSLDELELDGEDKAYVQKNTISYTREETTITPRIQNFQDLQEERSKLLRYQICAEYKRQGMYYDYDLSSNESIKGYAEYLSVSPHPAGKVCYKLKMEM